MTIFPQRCSRIFDEHELGEAHEPEDVGLELAPRSIERDRLDRPALAVAGVVDQHPHRAVGLLDRIHGGAHRVLVGDVEGQRLTARVLEIGDRLESRRAEA